LRQSSFSNGNDSRQVLTYFRFAKRWTAPKYSTPHFRVKRKKHKKNKLLVHHEARLCVGHIIALPPWRDPAPGGVVFYPCLVKCGKGNGVNCCGVPVSGGGSEGVLTSQVLRAFLGPLQISGLFPGSSAFSNLLRRPDRPPSRRERSAQSRCPRGCAENRSPS
jgi:hypothetical protein